MNIFILDTDPVKAAQLQCDKHVVKMILESAQMLSTAHRLLDGTQYKGTSKSGRHMKCWSHPDLDDILYSAVHVGHPCTLWTIESRDNYVWHYQHFAALSKEYEYRYAKQHKSWLNLGSVLKMSPHNIRSKGQTPFRLAMGASPECIDNDNPVESYRKFYKTKQDRFIMRWTGRSVPEWFD